MRTYQHSHLTGSNAPLQSTTLNSSQAAVGGGIKASPYVVAHEDNPENPYYGTSPTEPEAVTLKEVYQRIKDRKLEGKLKTCTSVNPLQTISDVKTGLFTMNHNTKQMYISLDKFLRVVARRSNGDADINPIARKHNVSGLYNQKRHSFRMNTDIKGFSSEKLQSINDQMVAIARAYVQNTNSDPAGYQEKLKDVFINSCANLRGLPGIEKDAFFTWEDFINNSSLVDIHSATYGEKSAATKMEM